MDMPKEDPKERLDRELIELLNELRVALPGVQVLFAFLLTVPFSDRFKELTEPQRDVYFAAFLCTAVSSVCLMAPTAYHRIRFRQADKEHMLRSANILAIVGIAFLALAVSLAVFVVTDLLFHGAAAGIATGIVAAALIVIWFGLPISRRIADEED
jgi:apolipoprotein N-acyltransferase